MSGRRRHPALDVRTPFFRPAWRRAVVVILLAIWTAIEAVWGNAWWALLAGGICAYMVWEFFLAFDPAHYEEKER